MASKPPPSIPWSTQNKPEDQAAPVSSTTKSSRTGKPIPLPSPSASIILISPSNKILLLHRVQSSSSFPSAHVFPGGNMEPSDGPISPDPTSRARHTDSPAYRTCALRELFEETGILLARASRSPSAPLLALPRSTRLAGRTAVHSHRTSLSSWLAAQSASAVLDTDSLVPFTRWVTPTNVPKRFTTQMYVYLLPASTPEALFSATGDEIETMAPEWRPAAEWLSLASPASDNPIILFPPQYILLHLISRFLDTSSSSSSPSPAALLSFIATGSPPWRDKVISPTALALPVPRPDGRAVLGLAHPGPELRDSGLRGDDEHVVLVRFGREGPRDVEVRLRRDVLDEARRGPAKL